MTLSALFQAAKDRARLASFDVPDSQLFFLLEKAFQTPKTDLLLQWNNPTFPSKKNISQFNRLIDQLLDNTPLAYLLESTYFNNRLYSCTRGVLIPRPETEDVLAHIVSHLKQKKLPQASLFECGSGSGVLSIELALKFPDFLIQSWDISKKAYNLAQKNAAFAQAPSVKWHRGSFFSAQAQSIQLNCPTPRIIVSNPPYIALSEMSSLDASVRLHEPKRALVGGVDGLSFYKRLLKQMKSIDAVYGYFECGATQSKAIEALAIKQGYLGTTTLPDYRGILRCTIVQK